MLEAEHRVELNKPVSDYLLELQGSVWDTVTVRDTVNMTTGLDCTEHDEPTRDARTNPQQCWFKWAASLNLAPTDDTTTTPMAVLREMQRRQPANQAFEYNSINTFVINRVVESVTHTPINELFSDKIWSKIGAQADGYVATSPQGYAMHFFGTNSNLRDMARFGMAFTASGNYIVPKAVVSDMQQSGNPAIYAKGHVGQLMMVSFPGESLTNGYQWDAIFSDGDMFKSGVGGQGIYVSPATDTVIAWFSSGTGRHQEQTFARAIAKQLSE
jgi:CubicO group peptidase (beta-lactamase class C family)